MIDQHPECAMSYQVVYPKSTPTPAADELRDLVAAMPIVIFAKALRAALQRPARARATLRTSQAS
ncbi:MAG TPA: hypothetical protein VKI18_11845 [Albitalea sp.]|nr:hypothetical protein [Albitalea sp.]